MAWVGAALMALIGVAISVCVVKIRHGTLHRNAFMGISVPATSVSEEAWDAWWTVVAALGVLGTVGFVVAAVMHVDDEGGNLVAVVSLTRHANALERHRAEIGGWVIAPARRGTGLARRMLDHLEHEARAWGCTMTDLGVRGGEHAEAVYRGLGFIEYGRLPSGFVRGHDVHDQVLMYKPLRVPTNGR